MGDHASSGKHQVDPDDLRHAARALRKQADAFEEHVINKFHTGMRPFSVERLDKISTERARRIRGKDYDESVAEDKTVPSGATSDWLNPFGRCDEADHLFVRVDDARAAAIRDATEVLHEMDRMAGALERAAKFYEDNEHTNTALTKQLMERFLTGTAGAGQA